MIKNLLLTFFKILFCFKIYIFHIVHYVLMPTFCSIYCKILKTKMICLFRIVLSTIYVSYHPKHLNNYQPEFEYHCIPVLYSSSISDYIMAYSMDYIISLQLFIEKKKQKQTLWRKRMGKLLAFPRPLKRWMVTVALFCYISARSCVK